MIELRSDTFTRPTPAMRRAMADAEVGDDVWEEDPTVQRLEAAVAERLGHEAALYVPSGTMGNQICLRLAAPRGTEVLANEDNHILWYEAAAAPVLSGVQLHPVARPARDAGAGGGQGPGPQRPLRGADQRHRRGEHPQPGRRGRPAPGGP